MQLIKVAGLLAALIPLSVIAGPVDFENTVFKRGIDICDRLAATGDVCNHGPGGDQPHICGKNDPRAILHCVKGKWTLDRKCGAGMHCTCTGSDDLICKS